MRSVSRALYTAIFVGFSGTTQRNCRPLEPPAKPDEQMIRGLPPSASRGTLVALMVGGPVVLEAARDFPASDPEADSETATMADKLATDGGTKQAATDPERPRSNMETCPNGEEWCSGPDGDDLPCFACYQPETKEV